MTYGAGGSTRERTHSTIARILNETALLPAAHLTCVGASRGEIDEIVDRYHEVGVRHIVALRGDPAAGIGTAYAAHPDGYQTSAELVAGIKNRHGDIEVSVSAYPEKHPESRDFDADIDTLKAKVDAGASARDHPGVLRQRSLLPLSRPRPRPRHRHPDRARHHADAQFQAGPQFRHPRRHQRAGLAGGKIRRPRRRPETRKLVAATVAAGQVQKLAKHGVDTFHFYTMNRADLVFAISHLLGIRPRARRRPPDRPSPFPPSEPP